MAFLPPFPSPPCPAYYISLSFDVQSVVSSDPSALVSCSCFLTCFALLLFSVVLELQKTQHQFMQCAETAVEEANQILGGGFSDTIFQFYF